MKRAYRTHHHSLCPTCGRRFIAYHGKKYCSRRCYLNSQLFPRAGVTVKDVRGCWGMTIKDAAGALERRTEARRQTEGGGEIPHGSIVVGLVGFRQSV